MKTHVCPYIRKLVFKSVKNSIDCVNRSIDYFFVTYKKIQEVDF